MVTISQKIPASQLTVVQLTVIIFQATSLVDHDTLSGLVGESEEEVRAFRVCGEIDKRYHCEA